MASGTSFTACAGRAASRAPSCSPIRPGGLGKSDIWTATRSAQTATFGSPAHVDGPVNTADIDWPNWLSADGCHLYLGHLETTTGDILVATRP